MKLTNEQIQAILGGAPEGATHYASCVGDYLNYDIDTVFTGGKWHECSIDAYSEPHDLTDLREILSLRQRVKELEDDHEKAYERWLAEHRQLKPCYECGTLVHELSPRSRCCMCEYNRAIFNEEENNQLRGQDYE